MDLHEFQAFVLENGVTAVCGDVTASDRLFTELLAQDALRTEPASRPVSGGGLHVLDWGLSGPPSTHFGHSPDPDFVREHKGRVRLVWPERIGQASPVAVTVTVPENRPEKPHQCPRGRCEHKSHVPTDMWL